MEDGLSLWLVALRNTPCPQPSLLDPFNALTTITASSTEHLPQVCVCGGGGRCVCACVRACACVCVCGGCVGRRGVPGCCRALCRTKPFAAQHGGLRSLIC